MLEFFFSAKISSNSINSRNAATSSERTISGNTVGAISSSHSPTNTEGVAAWNPRRPAAELQAKHLHQKLAFHFLFFFFCNLFLQFSYAFA